MSLDLLLKELNQRQKNIDESKWPIGCKKKHKDDIASLEILLRCDDCEPIKKIGNLQIELTPDNNFIEENNYPDWYDFKKQMGYRDPRILYLQKFLLIIYCDIHVSKILKRT